MKPVALAMNFVDLKKGQTARVVAIRAQDRDAVRLQEMGLTVGTTFRVVNVAPFGDPIEIDLRGYRLCLRKRETQGFDVLAVD